MRILISTIDSHSHLRTLVPLAMAARSAGHDVVVASTATRAAEVREEYGLEFCPVGFDWMVTPMAPLIGMPLAAGEADGFTDALIEHVLMGECGLSAGRDIMAFARSWQPDIVVRVAEEFGGYLAAETLGIPHVAVASGCTHRLRVRDIAPKLRQMRAEFGLPDQEQSDPYRYLLAAFTPPAYSPELDAKTLRHYRQAQPERVGEQLPEWVAKLPADQPLVYAAFGTVLSVPALSWKLGPVIANVVEALSGIDCQAIIAAGHLAGELAGQMPAHIHMVESIAQPLLLETTDLFITHAGFSGVREALRVAVPLVSMPFFGDQAYQAGECARLGVGSVVAPTVEPAALARACTEVLTEPSYRQTARQLSRTMLALPGIGTLLGDVEKIATAGQP